jgi:hypothetical protein
MPEEVGTRSRLSEIQRTEDSWQQTGETRH